MTHIHYKFSSKLSYDTVLFDGPRITLSDLKRQIMGREKLRAGDCDLQITNAQTKEEYTDDESPIPKGSSVIVRRIPVKGGKSSSKNIVRSDGQSHYAFGASRAMDNQSSTGALTFFSKMQMANLVDVDASEEDKIKVMISQSSYESTNLNMKLGTVLPVNYTCYRCGNTGHHIRNCPSSRDKNFEAPPRIKKSTGIPRSFMVEVDDPSIKGAMLTNCGRYAIPAIDAQAYAIGKKEKPPFIPQEKPESEAEVDPIPSELLCVICQDLLSDAVVIPCCGNSYCDDCIRSALLDSENHVCPTCSQSEVSPDTLIANKFLRQAVNNFKKERDHTKNSSKSSTSQSQSSAPTPSPAPNPPLLTVQSQLQKPHQSPYSQQPQTANTPPLSRVSGVPPAAATGPASVPNTPSASLPPLQSQPKISDNESEGKPQDDSAAAPSVLVSTQDPTAAPSQLIPLVNLTRVAEQPQTVRVNQQHSSSVSGPRHTVSSAYGNRSSSSSCCPTGVRNESDTQQLAAPSCSSSSSSSFFSTSTTTTATTSSSLYQTTPPPLFPSHLFPTFLPAHQSHGGYPPGYPPTTPLWMLPAPQGAPIPSPCSSTSASSSIPVLIPEEWYRYQRRKKEGSPPRESSYRRSSSNSKSSKSKFSRSYSRSSSRSASRSRSRSKGRSRELGTRPHPSSSYNYGYKRSRSPTPSSSSSPQVGYQSRSKSPSDHSKSRHHRKKSASSSSNSRRRGERSGREAGGSGREAGGSGDRNPYGQHGNQTGSLGLDRERYLQWNKEYQEWCEKYFSSYVGQFQQLPRPLLSLPPPPCPQWEDREGSRNHSNLDYRPQSRHTAPSSESSSDSHSPPSQSLSGSRSTPSQSSSDSRSPPSQSSSDGRSTPCEDRAQPRAYAERSADKCSRLPLTKNGTERNLLEPSTDNNKLKWKDSEDFRPLKHEQKRKKKVEEVRGEESSSLDADNSTDDGRKDKRRHNKDSATVRDKETTSDASESVPPLLNPDKRLDKYCERKGKEERSLDREKGRRRGRDSDSRKDKEREHKVKPSKEPDRVDTDGDKSSGGIKAPDSRSDRNRKRKGEDLERNERKSSLSMKPQSSKCPKTKTAEDPKSLKSESPKPFDRKQQKTEQKIERKTWPPTDGDIWEGFMKVKPQKKISINISLEGKRKEEKIDDQDLSCLASIAEKSLENMEQTSIKEEEERLNRCTADFLVSEKESSRGEDILFEEKIQPEKGEAIPTWVKATNRDNKGEMGEKIAAEKKDTGETKEEDIWHRALKGAEESVTGKEEEAERDRDDRREQEERAERERKEGRAEPWREELKRRVQEEEEAIRFSSQRSRSLHDRPTTTTDDGSTSVVGSCGGEEGQESRTDVNPLEENPQDRAAGLQLIQVPHSKCEKEDKEEQNEEQTSVHTDAPSALPHPSRTLTNRETEEDNEQQRQRSIERGRDRVVVRGRDREQSRISTLSGSHRSVAPSGGKDRAESTLRPYRDRETRTEKERQRHREREREREKESTRSKERRREEGRGRNGERHREKEKRNGPSSSSRSNSFSMSEDTERRDRQRGGDQGGNKSSSCPGWKLSSVRSKGGSEISKATDRPDQNTHKTDMLVDSKYKSKDHLRDHNNQDLSGDSRHQDRPAGTHRSPPSLSHCHSKERDMVPFQSSVHPPRGSLNVDLMQSQVERGECNADKVDKVVKEVKGETENEERVAEREGGGWWENEAVKLDGDTKWEGRREMEEAEKPSSVSSSESQDNSQDKQQKEKKKKQKNHRREKRQVAPEQLEEEELKKHKKEEEESGGEGSDRGRTGEKRKRSTLSST
ncbi:E3 ubiquitin-protein ligase RBBP6-like isoform X1 [Brachyistius frenatus]|uniref:E3 ubiquitin-protein ligase RBBP6-like isoform X1 n=2 Tax=Brachyistius frenatus TaxID=100188 RepID=UPI0037E75218